MNLIPITPELASSPGVVQSPLLSDVCESTLAMCANSETSYPWIGYLAQEDGRFVGTCAFKSKPHDACVEIAYFTFPGEEGRGVASEMSRKLILLASEGGLSKLKAQTMTQESASTSVLKKLGFVLTGSSCHPTDGTVWEWSRAL